MYALKAQIILLRFKERDVHFLRNITTYTDLLFEIRYNTTPKCVFIEMVCVRASFYHTIMCSSFQLQQKLHVDV